jgi:L-serine/L-threonine ammonia-lyase
MALHIQTPLIKSAALSSILGKPVWLKMEALQPSGSFKIRGVGFACEKHAAAGAKRFVSSSGGNAGLAVAYAGQQLQVPVVVVVPTTTSARAIELLRLCEAEVIVHGASWQEANELAQSMLSPQDAFVHPFDDPLLWQGHASMIDEVAATGIRPGAVVLSVGGGGLFSGVVEGLLRNNWHDVPVVAVETDGAASFNLAHKHGQRLSLESITSVATTLGAKQICQQAFELSLTHPVSSQVVTDAQAIAASVAFLDDHRVLVEPACGAALAPLYGNANCLQPYASLLVIVCGGSTTTLKQLLPAYS